MSLIVLKLEREIYFTTKNISYLISRESKTSSLRKKILAACLKRSFVFVGWHVCISNERNV